MSRWAPLEQRLAAKLVERGDCLVWTGPTFTKGHGSISANGKSARTHRVVWEMANGPIPAGMCVCHRCDNPPCCKLEHLFLGTVADNNADMRMKGRARGPSNLHGERNPNRRLTEEQVREIRALHAGGMDCLAISKILAVHHGTVWLVATRKTWREVA